MTAYIEGPVRRDTTTPRSHLFTDTTPLRRITLCGVWQSPTYPRTSVTPERLAVFHNQPGPTECGRCARISRDNHRRAGLPL